MSDKATVAGATRRLTSKVKSANGQSVTTFLVADVRDVLKENEELEAENRRLRSALDQHEAAFHTYDVSEKAWKP